jgi:hypothetical protein
MSIKTPVKTVERQGMEPNSATDKTTELLSSHSSFFSGCSASRRTRDRLRHRRQQMRKIPH